MPIDSKKIKDFKKNYLGKYPEYEQDILREIIYKQNETFSGIHEVNQVIDYLGLLPKDRNMYSALFELLKSRHDLGQNILEVATGKIPLFSGKYISPYQFKIGKGTVTAMDPAIIMDNVDGLTITRDKFTTDTCISPFDLITAIRPCEASIPIIESAAKNHKELFLATCGCSHVPYIKLDYVAWENYLYGQIKGHFASSYEVEKLVLKPNYHYPNMIFSVRKFLD